MAALGLPGGPPGKPAAPVTEADLAPLPGPAQRYLRFMGVVRSSEGLVVPRRLHGPFPPHGTGRTVDEVRGVAVRQPQPVARIFHIRLRMGGLVPVLGRDTYVDGHGRMLIRVLDAITVGDGHGEEFDVGELVTYLNDGIMIAPSMLLVPAVEWSPVDASTFDVALTDRGHTVAARVSVDERGAPVDFSTTDRFAADPHDAAKLVRARWTTPMEGWHDVGGGRRLWKRGQAVWHLPEGEFAYADFTPIAGSLAFNVKPGE